MSQFAPLFRQLFNLLFAILVGSLPEFVGLLYLKLAEGETDIELVSIVQFSLIAGVLYALVWMWVHHEESLRLEWNHSVGIMAISGVIGYIAYYQGGPVVAIILWMVAMPIVTFLGTTRRMMYW